MEIQAKLSFKHGRIVRILDSAGITIKGLARMCEWDYQNLLAFVSFKRFPKCEDKNSLFQVLSTIDPTVTEEEVFPEHYDKVKGALHTRVSVKDIPIENLLPSTNGMYQIENSCEDQTLFNVGFEKAFLEIKRNLTKREVEIIEMHYGLGGKKPHTFKEIGKKIMLSEARVQQIKDKSLRKLRWSHKFKPYEGVL